MVLQPEENSQAKEDLLFTKTISLEVAIANKAVMEVLATTSSSSFKRGNYKACNKEVRVSIARALCCFAWLIKLFLD